MMKTNELKKKAASELLQEISATLREQFNLRMQHATRQLSQTHQIKNVRRKLAQLKTVLREKTGQVL
jgi:large subunit ribosomal protein L29